MTLENGEYMYRVLVVEPDKFYKESILKLLSELDYDLAVESVSSGDAAIEFAANNCIDILISEILVEDMDGFTLIDEIKEINKNLKFIIVSGNNEFSNVKKAIKLGAIDYIHKPFGVMELRARVLAHLRREHREHSVRMALGRSCFNLSLKQMFVDEQEIALTKAEYQICEFLAKNRGQVFSKEQILEQVFGFDSESNDSTIITHIKNIRMKLSDYDYMPIKTVWGIGYKWEE